MKDVQIKIDDKKYTYPEGTLISQLSHDFSDTRPYPIVAGKVCNDLKSVNHTINEDCIVDLMDISSSIGHRIYERSLVFLMVKVVSDLFPEASLSAEYTISNGLYCKLNNFRNLTKNDVDLIEMKMKELVLEDIPFERSVVSKEEAIKIFEESNNSTRANLFSNYRDKKKTALYKLKDYTDYMYGYLVPSTGILKTFKLRFYMPGFLLLLPKKEKPYEMPEFVEQAKLFNILRESEKWSSIQGVYDAKTLNQAIHSNSIKELIKIAEGLHEKKIVEIANMITEEKERFKLIMIAGPSSSGKTTFAKRLMVQLKVNGIRPISISLDDYFVNRQDTPLDENGEYDFEALESINVDKFNRDITSLIQGEVVELPKFDFVEGYSVPSGQKLQISDDQPIIIEGIHGLNDKLTASIPRSRKFYIYVSALTQLNLDCSNRIKTTDARLMRRMVRDAKYRGITPEETLARWPSVRKGEDKNIFPYQENADTMFNSHLIYELAVLKPFAEKLLGEMKSNNQYIAEAKNLLNITDFFEPLSDTTFIPMNSIIREFIGGSSFYNR